MKLYENRKAVCTVASIFRCAVLSVCFSTGDWSKSMLASPTVGRKKSESAGCAGAGGADADVVSKDLTTGREFWSLRDLKGRFEQDAAEGLRGLGAE